MSKTIPLLLLGALLGYAASFIPQFVQRGVSAGTPGAEHVEQTVREILNGKDPVQRVAQIGALLPTLDLDAVPALLRAYEAAPLDGGDPEIVLLTLWWVQLDPNAAFEWTRSDWRANFGSVLAALFRGWARVDAREAWTRAQAVGFTVQRDLAMAAAMAGWDESGQPGLIESIQQLPVVDQQRVGETLARRRVVMLGVDGAMRWVDSLPDDTFREVMTVRVASAAAAYKEGAPRAAEWAQQRIRSDDRISGFPRRIGTRWIMHDPISAMTWLAGLPAGADRDDGVGETYRSWLMHDRNAAVAWAEKTGLQSWNQPAFALYAKALSREAPRKAIELARQLPDPGLRDSSTIVIGRVWVELDRDAAEAWFDEVDLPEDLRAQARMVGSNAARERNLARRAQRAQSAAQDAAPATAAN
jgi:hypothetical protein